MTSPPPPLNEDWDLPDGVSPRDAIRLMVTEIRLIIRMVLSVAGSVEVHSHWHETQAAEEAARLRTENAQLRAQNAAMPSRNRAAFYQAMGSLTGLGSLVVAVFIIVRGH